MVDITYLPVGDGEFLYLAARTRGGNETLQGRKRWSGPRKARLTVFRWVTRYNNLVDRLG